MEGVKVGSLVKVKNSQSIQLQEVEHPEEGEHKIGVVLKIEEFEVDLPCKTLYRLTILTDGTERVLLIVGESSLEVIG